MKTFFLKSFVLFTLCFVSHCVSAQHTEFEHNSSNSDPILQLTETGANNYTRFHFRNTNSTDRWAFNARLSSTSDHIMGGYYNGQRRFLFNEDEHTFSLFSTSSQPELDLVFQLDDGTGPVATYSSSIKWNEETGGTFAEISAKSNQGGSALPDRLVLSGGMANGVGSNFMTMYNDYTDFGESAAISGGGSARVRIKHNSSSSDPNLRLIEDSDGDYARIMFTNNNSSSNFAMAARPGSANPRWQVAYDSNPILTVHSDDIQDGLGDDGRVGINNSNPQYALDLPNNSLDRIGKARAKDWDTYSDGRVKKDVKKIENGVDLVMKLNPVTYDHYASSFEDGSLALADEFSHEMGFIAQEIYKVLPGTAHKPEDETKDLWSVSYERIIPVLTKAIQEQQAIIENLQDRLTAFEGVVAAK
jgi:hypothetical protein